MPNDLEAKVEKLVQKHPDITWHRAVRLMSIPMLQRTKTTRG